MSKVYKVIGYIWSETPHFSEWDISHKFPQYERLHKSESLIEADSLNECMLWAVDYIPEELIGLHIMDMTHNSGEFFSGANKSYWAYELGTEDNDEILKVLIRNYKESAESARNDYEVRDRTRGWDGVTSWQYAK